MHIARFLLFFISITSLAVSADWSKDVALLKGMVVMDKAYIPMLLLTRDVDTKSSKDALVELGTC
jgi:hypothetical protein